MVLTRRPAGPISQAQRVESQLPELSAWHNAAEVFVDAGRAECSDRPVIRCQGKSVQLTKPKAFVLVKPRRAASDARAAELGEFVKDRITPDKSPRWIEFVAQFPETATGKIQRYKLRESR